MSEQGEDETTIGIVVQDGGANRAESRALAEALSKAGFPHVSFVYLGAGGEIERRGLGHDLAHAALETPGIAERGWEHIDAHIPQTVKDLALVKAIDALQSGARARWRQRRKPVEIRVRPRRQAAQEDQDAA